MNKFCLDTSNLYQLIPTIKFLNKLIKFLLMTYSTCHDVIATDRRASTIREGNQSSKKKITFEENGSLNNFPP